MGTCYGAAMYVVGVDRLSAFWEAHPQAEGELRALHALLAATEADRIGEARAIVGEGGERCL